MVKSHIVVEKGPIAVVKLDRPEVRNAMSDETLTQLTEAFADLAKDPALRAVLICGEGPDFCAGADVEWMKRAGTLPPKLGIKDARLLAEMLKAVADCPVPVIVAAHGNVYGGGLGLVAACDIAILADDAKLCFSECRLGILPAVISCWVIPKIGAANARRFYATAELFSAAQAVQMGLAHEAVPAAQVPERLAFVTKGIVRNGPNAVRAAKALIAKLDRKSLGERIDLAVETLVELRSSPEGQEGLAAFLEKRPAAWQTK